jgi:hypothetical protein
MRAHTIVLVGLILPFALNAQSTAAADSTPPLPGPVLARELQIAAAVTPIPPAMQGGAKVLGYSPERKLITLREGTNDLICLADDPSRPGYHVACYHRLLDPFMARGRALRARGVKEEKIDSMRLADVKGGRLAMPARPTALYQLFAPADSVDATTGTARGARALHVMYIPYATAKSTGLSTQPIKGPWLMNAGLPWAHIMYTP